MIRPPLTFLKGRTGMQIFYENNNPVRECGVVVFMNLTDVFYGGIIV